MSWLCLLARVNTPYRCNATAETRTGVEVCCLVDKQTIGPNSIDSSQDKINYPGAVSQEEAFGSRSKVWTAMQVHDEFIGEEWQEDLSRGTFPRSRCERSFAELPSSHMSASNRWASSPCTDPNEA